jgi:hypothetical protein
MTGYDFILNALSVANIFLIGITMSENTSFAFVANRLDVNCNLPFKIFEDCYFQKAGFTQINHIKNYLAASGYFSDFFKNNLSPYELVYVEEQNISNQKSFKSQLLETQDWKYYVLTFLGNNSKIHNLEEVACLAEIELELGFQFIYHKEGKNFGVLKNPTHTFNYFHELESKLHQTESINDGDFQDLGSIYQDFQQLDETKYADIKQAIRMLYDLKHLPHNSKFKILGLFTIIEFLITHKPIDTGDSITRQVTNKISLLSHRFTKKLNYSHFFGNTPESTIWKKLYAYRSSIAHGGEADFAKELSVLKDDSTARQFLRRVVKMLLRHSLTEPQLYNDLREC